MGVSGRGKSVVPYYPEGEYQESQAEDLLSERRCWLPFGAFCLALLLKCQTATQSSCGDFDPLVWILKTLPTGSATSFAGPGTK